MGRPAKKAPQEGVTQPPLPEGVPWPEQTVAWWAAVGRSSVTARFTEMDWLSMLDTALCHADVWGGNLDRLAELRARLAKFGMTASDTPAARQARPEPTAGRDLRASIEGKYQLRPDEKRILDDACHIADVIELLRAEFVADGRTMVKGSMGQQVLNPLLAEQKTHQSALAALMRQLKLPDDPGAAPTNQQRDAANHKWASGRGRGA